MKKYITIIISFIGIFNIYAQEGVEVPLTKPVYQIQSGTYKKDLNNKYGNYIGTWEGTWEGKKFTLVLGKLAKKKNDSPSGFYYYRDMIIGWYKITNLSSGAVIANNLGEQNYDLIKITGGSGKNNELHLQYTDPNICYASGNILLSGDPTTNQLEYSFTFDDFWIQEDCPYLTWANIPYPIPTITINLTRL